MTDWKKPILNIALIDLSNLVMSLLAGTVSAPAFFVEAESSSTFCSNLSTVLWYPPFCPYCLASVYNLLGDGYRLCIVSADHRAVQGGLTDVLRQLAVGFSRPQSQSLVAWLRELYRDRLRQLANPACRRSSALF